MSSEAITQFVQEVTRDHNLQEKLRNAAASASSNPQEAIAAIAREHGYEISPEELSKASLVDSLTELDLKQLDSVAGGYYTSYNTNSPFDD